jgi:hypothetical protein
MLYLIVNVPSLWPTAMCPVVGLKAIPLEAWLGGNSERVEAPPFGADLLSPEI